MPCFWGEWGMGSAGPSCVRRAGFPLSHGARGLFHGCPDISLRREGGLPCIGLWPLPFSGRLSPPALCCRCRPKPKKRKKRPADAWDCRKTPGLIRGCSPLTAPMGGVFDRRRPPEAAPPEAESFCPAARTARRGLLRFFAPRPPLLVPQRFNGVEL